MSKAVQQSLDAKVFAPYQVSERKLSFGGSFVIDKKDLADKGPGLDPEKTYLFMVQGKLAGVGVKFGEDNSGTISIKLSTLEKYEEIEVPDPLEQTPEKPIDKPAKKVEETISAGEPVFKEDELPGDLPEKEQSLSPTAEAELLEEEAQLAAQNEELPEPSNVIPMPARKPKDEKPLNMPPCYGTYEDGDEACNKCLDGEACLVVTKGVE